MYSLKLPDYASIVAETSDGEIVLVKQYRAAVDRITTELPSGFVDPGEDPGAAAVRELEEEAGYTAETGSLQLAGALTPDTGRTGNRIWCYYAKVRKMATPPAPEDGIEPLTCSAARLMELVGNGEFECALHVAVLFLCVSRGFVKLGSLA